MAGNLMQFVFTSFRWTIQIWCKLKWVHFVQKWGFEGKNQHNQVFTKTTAKIIGWWSEKCLRNDYNIGLHDFKTYSDPKLTFSKKLFCHARAPCLLSYQTFVATTISQMHSTLAINNTQNFPQFPIICAQDEQNRSRNKDFRKGFIISTISGAPCSLRFLLGKVAWPTKLQWRPNCSVIKQDIGSCLEDRI